MRYRWFAILLAACTGLLPYHAAALDCQNPTRGDLRAICGDPALRMAEEARSAQYERMVGAMPADDRSAFAAFEMAWINGRGARCPSPRGRDVDQPCLKQVIEDHTAELQAIERRMDATAGRLRFRARKRDEGNPNIDIHATYVEFDAPRNPGERLFNEQVLQLVTRLPFTQPVDARTIYTWQDTLDVRTVYLSSRLVAASFAQWVCCGAHGSGGTYTVNIDAGSGTALVPERWFRLDEVAAACWYQFVESERGGEAFRQIYPLREAIDRFGEALRRPSIWSFSARGADLQFSALMGFAAGPYTCRLGYSELAKTAAAGMQLPP